MDRMLVSLGLCVTNIVRLKKNALIPAAIIFALTACGEVHEVNVVLQREGGLVVMSYDEVNKSYSDTQRLFELRDSTRTLRGISQNDDYFLRADISSSVELYHRKGVSSISGPLNINGHVSLCRDTSHPSEIFVLVNTASSVPSGWHYSFILYKPQLDAIGFLNNPQEDVCAKIDRGIPNKDPYFDGSTHYLSNEIRITADELNAAMAGAAAVAK